MAILTQHFKLGQISVSIPASILQSEETELSNSIVINSTYKNKKISLKFKYYIIILNKKVKYYCIYYLDIFGKEFQKDIQASWDR